MFRIYSVTKTQGDQMEELLLLLLLLLLILLLFISLLPYFPKRDLALGAKDVGSRRRRYGSGCRLLSPESLFRSTEKI